MKTKINSIVKKGEVEAYFIFEREKFPKEIKKLEKYSKEEKFEGKEESHFYFNDGKKKTIICGMGNKKEFDLDTLRKAVAYSFNYANGKKAKILVLNPPKLKNTKDIFIAIGEAITLSNYRFDRFKSKKKKEDCELCIEEIQLKHSKNRGLENALNEGIIKGKAQNFSSEIDDLPANILTPAEFAKIAQKLAKSHKMNVKVFGKEDMEKMKMNAILAVSKGSAQPPMLVVMEYNKGKKKLPLYVLVGKGITFDSGGIDLKPSKGLMEMKYDKTGACNILGAMKGISELKLPVRIIGIMPMTENMPGGKAQKPGDIVTAYNGKTIEIINTDAEGRLILADALAYAAKKKPKAIIDMATLTGAAFVCLGKHAIAMMGNDEKLCKKFEEAGRYTYERFWRLPLWKEYSEMIKGEITDVKNLGSMEGEAGTITAGAFLHEFIGENKWVHLDIASVDTAKGHPYLGSRASGTGVRLLIETVKKLSKK